MQSLTGGRRNHNVPFTYNLPKRFTDSFDLLDEILLVLLLSNLKNPSAFKSNFYSTNYGFACSLDRDLCNKNNVNNIYVP